MSALRPTQLRIQRGNGAPFCRCKVARAWRWPLTSS